jgi:sigma-B regulation protein RsbU (phosphoserine phosphatase)
VHASIQRAVAELTTGEDAQRHFDLAAERIQHALLEVSLPDVDGLEVGVHAEPARLVGGDYIDLFAPVERSLVFGLGDASGKSLAAALNALMLRYLVRGLVSAIGREDLQSVVTHTNNVVTEDLSDGAFITFLLGSIDASTGALRVVNAGHEPPLILRANSLAVETMDMHDIVLGIDNDTNYVQQEVHLCVGDAAMFYTDGLTEATNARGELYTIERLKEAFIEHRALPAQALADEMFVRIRKYSAAALRDDATILVFRRT